jgi:amino acid transporter
VSDGELGLTEAVSIALGGMIGGGIYAVLGVVTGIAGARTWAAFVLAGVVALSTGYAYIRLNDVVDRDSGTGGGSVSFIQSFTGNATLAGMVGWTLLFGYVGSMAMYAFAFAEFLLVLPGVPTGLAGLPLRPVVSVVVIASFVGLNLLGAHATGAVENVLTSAKVLVLVAFGIAGLAYALGVSAEPAGCGGGLLRRLPGVAATVLRPGELRYAPR